MTTKFAPSQERRTKAVAELAIAFGSINVAAGKLSLPFSIPRSELTLDQADRLFCNRRLAGSLLARPAGVTARQQSLPGFEQTDLTIRLAAEVKRFRVTRQSISGSLSIDTEADGFDVAVLIEFVGREGMLTIETVSDLVSRQVSKEAA